MRLIPGSGTKQGGRGGVKGSHPRVQSWVQFPSNATSPGLWLGPRLSSAARAQGRTTLSTRPSPRRASDCAGTGPPSSPSRASHSSSRAAVVAWRAPLPWGSWPHHCSGLPLGLRAWHPCSPSYQVKAMQESAFEPKTAAGADSPSAGCSSESQGHHYASWKWTCASPPGWSSMYESRPSWRSKFGSMLLRPLSRSP